MKYLLFTGCSYGQQERAFRDLKNMGFLKDVITYNLQGSSLGSRYQLYSAINLIEKIKNTGVPTEDIYLVCQWSSAFRVTTIYDIKNYKNAVYNYKNIDLNTWALSENCGLYSVGIDDFGFMNTTNQINTIRTYRDDKNLREFLIDNLPKTSPEDRMIQYHLDIMNLQNYLKVNDIKYSFLFFNSSLTGFNFDRSDSFLNGLEIKNVQSITGVDVIEENDGNKKFKLPKIWKESIIYNNKKWEPFEKLIDWTNFILYENDRIKYGGIDEFTLENIGEVAYLTYKQKPVSFGDHLNQYGDFRYIIESGLFKKVNKEFIHDNEINIESYKNISTNDYNKLTKKHI